MNNYDFIDRLEEEKKEIDWNVVAFFASIIFAVAFLALA